MKELDITEVSFHADHVERAKVAINVKVYGRSTKNIESYFARLGYTYNEFEDLSYRIFEGIAEDFWEYLAPELAGEYGFSEKVYAEGRSSGWLIPLWNNKEIHEEDITPKILKAYRGLKKAIDRVTDHADVSLRNALRERWYEEELEFLKDHSLSVRSMIHAAA